jgi:hypothetical protein
MAELAATRAKVEAAATSSTDSSVSADDDRDNELKLAREAAREHTAQWAATHPQGRRGGSPDGSGQVGAHAAAVSPTAAAAQTGADASAARLTEIVAFSGGAALPPRIGTMVTMGSKLLSGSSVPTVGGLPSPRPTTSSGPR